jgi:hypothetical protein
VDDDEPTARRLLLSRFRSVAFAALGEGVTEAELLEALQVAVAADIRDRETTPRRHLYAVPATGA